MGLVAAVKSCFGQFATFSGRARRAEYWMFYLFLNIVSLVGFGLVMLAGGFGAVVMASQPDPSPVALIPYFVVIGLWMLVSLVLMIPYLAVSARRLHDMGQSGHWLWLTLAGLAIVPVVMAFFDSQWGANRWGADPKAAERARYAPPQQYGYAAPAQYGQPAQHYGQPPVPPQQYPNPPQPPTQ